MPILTSEIKMYLSGGAANADVNASLGGVISSVEVSSQILHNLFDIVTPEEALAGDVEYRCIYLKNTNGGLTFFNAVAWINSITPSLQTSLSLGLGTSGISATETAVGNESTAPTSVTFSAPLAQGAGIALGDLTAGDTRAVWLRRTINAGALAYNQDGPSISIGGGTPA